MKFPNTKIYKSIALGLLLVAGGSACNEEEFLKETPLSFLATSNLYGTVLEMQEAVYALHSEVRVFYLGDDQSAGGTHQNAIICGKGTDTSYDGENPASTSWLSNWKTQLVPANETIVRWFWERPFELVQYANVLIASLEDVGPDATMWQGYKGEYEKLLAEAKFFRAYSYRILVTVYGDVPLLDEPVTTGRTDYIRAPKEDIYALMQEDLEYGVENLPQRGEEDQPGRVTRGAAGHFLTELYITLGEYDKAIAAATAVIDGGYALMTERFGEQLGNDDELLGGGDVYYDLFRYGNQNLATNTEAIWVIQVQNDVEGGRQYDGERMWGNAYFRLKKDPSGVTAAFVGDQPDVSTEYISTFGRPVSWNRPTNLVAYDVWQRFSGDWDNDIRNARHNIFRDWTYMNPDSEWDGKPIVWSDYASGHPTLEDTCQYIFPYFMKVASPGLHFTTLDRQGAGVTHIDLYGIRLAETYLLRAEAYMDNGDLASAAADINVVRGRANALAVTAADVNIDLILEERIRELYTEEFRLLTLMRLGLLVERTRLYHTNPIVPGANIQDYNNLFPVPQGEIDLNTGSDMEQNPGYE